MNQQLTKYYGHLIRLFLAMTALQCKHQAINKILFYNNIDFQGKRKIAKQSFYENIDLILSRNINRNYTNIFSFIDFCHNMDKAIRSGETLPLGCGNILFYGHLVRERLHLPALLQNLSMKWSGVVQFWSLMRRTLFSIPAILLTSRGKLLL